MNSKKWTLAEIKEANTAAGQYFFSRDTMKFFGDTMRSFKVDHDDQGRVYVVRVKQMRDRDGRNMGGVGDRREFDPATGHISTVIRGGTDQ
jgi:hypothetical protein